MFVGREKELRVLENEYNKKGFSMTILYGRRRIGKSTLLLEFIKRKKTIFYTASRVGAVRNLELLSQQVIQTLAPNMSGVSFSSIENLFSFMTNNLSDEKLVFIIDELPYWADVVLHAKCKNVANKMQKIGFKKRHFNWLLNAK